MSIETKFKRPQFFCQAIHEVMADRGWRGLHRHVWNRYDSSKVVWWISPIGQRPAFKYGKLFFSDWRYTPSSMFAGLHIEKGLGDGTREIAKRELVLGSDWIWHDFVTELSSGPNSTLQSILAKLQKPVDIRICTEIAPPDGKFETPRSSSDEREMAFCSVTSDFKWRIGAETPILTEVGRKSRDWTAFGQVLKDLEKHPWNWVDVFIGHLFTRNDGAEQSTDARRQNAEQIWDQVLCHWAEWLR